MYSQITFTTLLVSVFIGFHWAIMTVGCCSAILYLTYYLSLTDKFAISISSIRCFYIFSFLTQCIFFSIKNRSASSYRLLQWEKYKSYVPWYSNRRPSHCRKNVCGNTCIYTRQSMNGIKMWIHTTNTKMDMLSSALTNKLKFISSVLHRRYLSPPYGFCSYR